VVKRIINNEGDTLYYFVDEDHHGAISANVFGQEMYWHEGRDVMTTEAYPFDDIKEMNKSTTAFGNILVPSEIEVGAEYVLSNSDNSWVKEAKISGIEDINVKAGNFENCLKIVIKTKWEDGKTYSETIWLKRGVGMVKWIRTTGRIDELVKYSIPQID